MARIETVTYYCDYCKKQVKDETELSRLSLEPSPSFSKISPSTLPGDIFGRRLRPLTEPLKVDVCNSCMMGIYLRTVNQLGSEGKS